MVKIFFAVLLVCCPAVFADSTLNIAVTSSFKPAAEVLAEGFQEITGISLKISTASTGVLYQQILSGAPFDVFFAADSERPHALVDKLNADASQLFPYAQGRLVLVSYDPAITHVELLKTYSDKVVIANPAHAPYGAAAKQVLEAVGYTGQVVLASNVTQARQYLSLKLTRVGLIAESVSQIFTEVHPIPSDLYTPIMQSGFVIKPSSETEMLLAYLQSAEAKSVITSLGYDLPTL